MAQKDVNFNVDEKTSVPTFQEISEVFSKIEKHPHYNKIILGLMSFFILIILAGGTYLYLDSSENLISGFVVSAGDATKGLTGYFTYDINKSNPEVFGISIKEKQINLLDEEKDLEKNLNSKCENEKTILKRELGKDCVDEKAILESEIEEWKEKYKDCDDELDECESSGDE